MSLNFWEKALKPYALLEVRWWAQSSERIRGRCSEEIWDIINMQGNTRPAGTSTKQQQR